MTLDGLVKWVFSEIFSVYCHPYSTDESLLNNIKNRIMLEMLVKTIKNELNYMVILLSLADGLAELSPTLFLL